MSTAPNPFARTSSVMMFRMSAISSRSSSTSSRTVSLWFSTCLIALAGSFAASRYPRTVTATNALTASGLAFAKSGLTMMTLP